MALVMLSKVEQRLDAVRAVLGGAKVTEVGAEAETAEGVLPTVGTQTTNHSRTSDTRD